MAFRRIIFSGEKAEEAKKDLERLFSLPKHKIDFPSLKIDIKQGAKPNTFVVDLNGEGADSVSKKVKDIGNKFQISTIIKNEIPMKKSNIINEVVKKLKLNEIGPKGPAYEIYENFIIIPKEELEYAGVDIDRLGPDIELREDDVVIKISELVQCWLDFNSR